MKQKTQDEAASGEALLARLSFLSRPVDLLKLERALKPGQSQCLSQYTVNLQADQADQLAAGFVAWCKHYWPRLVQELASLELQLDWRLDIEKSRMNREGLVGQLSLHLKGCVYCPCQRCLQPVAVNLEEAREFLLVESDAAAQVWLKAGDDVLASSSQFGLAEFLEEEILLALPLLVLHEQCDEQALSSLQLRLNEVNLDRAKRISDIGEAAKPVELGRKPFAGLAALKKI